MITWRKEGERSVAMLGKIEVGRVIASDFEDGYMAYLDLKSSGPIQRYWTSDLFPTLPAAKDALAEAIAKWCERAGLALIDADQDDAIYRIGPHPSREEMT